MKTIVAAMALAFAYPAAAQTAAPDPHAGHSQHQQGQHPQGDHKNGHHQGEHAECCCGKMDEAKMKGCKEHGRHGEGAQPSAQPKTH